MDNLETVLKKISAIHTINEEIIQRIQRTVELNPIIVQGYQYHIEERQENDVIQFYIREEEEAMRASTIISTWECASNFVEVSDIFNDRLDYKCNSFSTLSKLNEEMFKVAQKYEMFGNSDKAIHELENFKKNFEITQTYLGQLEAQLIEPNSEKDIYEKKVRQINGTLNGLAQCSNNIGFEQGLQQQNQQLQRQNQQLQQQNQQLQRQNQQLQQQNQQLQQQIHLLHKQYQPIRKVSKMNILRQHATFNNKINPNKNNLWNSRKTLPQPHQGWQ